MKGRNLVLMAVALGALVAVAPSWCLVVSLALAQGMAALGVALLLRAGQISFGHAIYYAIGAYVVAFGSRRVSDVFILVPLAVLVSAAAGYVVSLFVARYRGIFFAMLNLALSMVVHTVLQKAYSYTGGSDGVRVLPVTFASWAPAAARQPFAVYGVASGALLLVLYVIGRYYASPLGEALRAFRSNETRLDYLGVSPQGVLGVGYVISAALVGLGGSIAALNTGYVTPELAYWTRSAEFVFIALLGGVAHVAGPILGAVTLELLRTYAVMVAANAWELLLGAILIGLVLFAPQGVMGILARARKPYSG